MLVDVMQKELKVGSIVAYSFGHYKDLKIGVIVKLYDTKVRIVHVTNNIKNIEIKNVIDTYIFNDTNSRATYSCLVLPNQIAIV